MSEFELKAWIEWLGQRPESVRKAAEEYPPGRYRLRTDGEESASEYLLVGYSEQEDDSVTAILHTDGFMGIMPREVFGVSLTDLIAIDTLKTREN